MLAYFDSLHITDTEATVPLNGAIAFFLLTAFWQLARVRRFVRRETARHVSRVNPYFYLQAANP
jgi:hypothetical protein